MSEASASNTSGRRRRASSSTPQPEVAATQAQPARSRSSSRSRAASSAQAGDSSFTVKVGQLSKPAQQVRVTPGQTRNQLFRAMNITLARDTKTYVRGEEVKGDYVMKEHDVIIIAGDFSNG